MWYEINISINGIHLFATDKRSIPDYNTLLDIHAIFKVKFPESEGYEITITQWEKSAYEVNI